ncbi:MAG: sugar phosphate nucleotidyltransferase [Candidatus Cloacimonas sp.]|jgi:choline kinase|nr:sugar phosphate nucleotidyltransferase [Candidatus Cloacimonas sp.]
MKAVIIAAGYGSRLWNVSNQIPKTLLPYGGGTILSTIIIQMIAAGVTELAIVLGFNQQYIRDYLATQDFGIPLSLLENTDWDKGNAISVYKARDYAQGEPFLLSMSDHLLKVDALRQIINSGEKSNLLLVDPFIKDNFDLDDATKVQVEHGFIASIGKELNIYNALDCGIFRLEQDFFTAVETALSKGIDSISGAISELIATKRIMVVSLTKPQQWLDIDTPEAYEHAKASFNLP